MANSSGAVERRAYWREHITAQSTSGLSARAYCRRAGLHEHSFYAWRKRLRVAGAPVRFALVEPIAASAPPTRSALELVLASGDCLRIFPGFDPDTLRTVLVALRP
jgi:transposase-like protein